ncbi:MAG: hypothetical protein ACYTGH_15525, partial [Planctomycetota bacterium]
LNIVRERWPNQPCIVLTGRLDNTAESDPACRRYPPLTKPFTLRGLLAAIESALAASGTGPN